MPERLCKKENVFPPLSLSGFLSVSASLTAWLSLSSLIRFCLDHSHFPNSPDHSLHFFLIPPSIDDLEITHPTFSGSLMEFSHFSMDHSLGYLWVTHWISIFLSPSNSKKFFCLSITHWIYLKEKSLDFFSPLFTVLL